MSVIVQRQRRILRRAPGTLLTLCTLSDSSATPIRLFTEDPGQQLIEDLAVFELNDVAIYGLFHYGQKEEIIGISTHPRKLTKQWVDPDPQEVCAL